MSVSYENSKIVFQGIKDAGKIREFVAAVRAADAFASQ